MLVKHNLFYNQKRTTPIFGKNPEFFKIKENETIIKNLEGWSYHYFEIYGFPEGENKNDFYYGFHGKIKGNVKLYVGQGKGYRECTVKNNLVYTSLPKGYYSGTNTYPIKNNYIQGHGENEILIKFFFLTDEEPDIVIPNIQDIDKSKQPLYPPEGNYSEITPI